MPRLNFDAFTFVPAWVFQDLVVLVLAVLAVGFIVQRERRPGVILLEFVCFVFLNAAVYENLATAMGLYGFGRSIVMVFNVPITVPVIEYLVIYTVLGAAMRIPVWTVPVLVGGFGVLTDLVVDPLALSQVVETDQGTIGPWSWFIGAGDVDLFGAPIYNYTGWMILCGYSAALLLVGRWWFRRSGCRPWVGIAYPVAAMVAALLVMVSPLSQFLLWLGPLVDRGGPSEYVMFSVALAALLAVLVAWRGRMRRPLRWRQDWIIPVVFGGLHASNLIFLMIGGQWRILSVSLAPMAVQFGVIGWAFTRATAAPEPESTVGSPALVGSAKGAS